MALLGTLVDNFRAATLDTALWNAVNSAGNVGFQAGGRYTFIVQAGATGDATLTSDITYDLTGSHVHVELIEAGVQEAGLETYPIILTQAAANQNNALVVVVSAGTVGLYEIVAGVPNGLAFPSYDAVAMRWWRIRESGGTVYFESAPKVRGPWTVRASVVPTIAITSLYMKIRTFDFAVLTTAKQTAVSNVNYLSPPDLPFPNGAIETGMEIAFGADLTADQSTWTWTNVTPPDGESVFMNQDVTVTRGRADESADVTATAADMQLDNPDGDFTPDNPVSQYYPNVDTGTPSRWWINAGSPRLYLRPYGGSRAQIASISTLNITSDFDLRIDMHMKTTHPDGSNAIVASRANTFGAYSWRVEIEPDRTVRILWSTTGVTPALDATSTIPVVPMSARATLRVTLDVNNGAGGHDVKFYIGYDGVNGAFTQIGDTVTGSGTTSIFNVAEPLTLGHPSEIHQKFSLDADVYRFQLRQGIGGSVIVDADFTDQVSGVPAFVDSTGFAWTITSPAELSDRRFRMYGTADSWEPIWPWGDLSSQQPGGIDKGQARVDMEIAGILRRMGAGSAPLESPLRRAISFDPTVVAYWPIEDGEDSTLIASGLSGGTPMVVVGDIGFAADNSETLLGSKPLAVMTATGGFVGSVVATFSNEWQFDQFIYIPLSTPNDVTIARITGDVNATVATWALSVGSSSITLTGLSKTGATLVSSTVAGTELFDRWVRMKFTCDQSGGNIDWDVSWFPVQYPASGGWTFGGLVAGTVGGVISVAWPVDGDASGITLGHWSVRNVAGVDTYGNAATGWLGDTAVERIIRLCAEQDIYLRIIGNASTSAKMGTQQIATLLTLLDDAKEADGGILYETLDALGLIIRTRESMYNQPPNMVLDAQRNELQNPFKPIRDDQKTRNDVTVTRRGGSSVQLIDQASIDKIGIYDDSATLNLYQDTQIADAAGWELHQGVVPGMRYPSVTTDLGFAPQVIDEWLTCDIAAMVHVTNLPPQHPNVTVRVLAQGYSEPIGPTDWKPVMNCSPGQVWDVTELDGDWVQDQYLLRLETDGSELDSGVDENDTTFEVLVTDGPEWVTDAGEFPFDIRVDGERVTVTAISAATAGVQDFTVTRSVNGVVRAHAAGTPVELWYQPVLAR